MSHGAPLLTKTRHRPGLTPHTRPGQVSLHQRRQPTMHSSCPYPWRSSHVLHIGGGLRQDVVQIVPMRQREPFSGTRHAVPNRKRPIPCSYWRLLVVGGRLQLGRHYTCAELTYFRKPHGHAQVVLSQGKMSTKEPRRLSMFLMQSASPPTEPRWCCRWRRRHIPADRLGSCCAAGNDLARAWMATASAYPWRASSAVLM